MLVQEDPQEIAKRSHLSLLTICAYSMLLFDVRGRDRKGKWHIGQLRSARPIQDTDIARMGHTLKHLACCKTSADLEEHIDVLWRL
jgi:hypothetical protein